MKNQVFNISIILVGCLALLSMAALKSNMQDTWEAPAKYVKMKNPYTNSTDDEKIGRIMYAKHCKSCHGTKGKGDGKKAGSIDTPIGDFSDDSFKKQTDGSLYYKTIFGRDDMPSFEKKITDEEERWLIVNHIRSLGE
ncbi:c-type cytochrome [Changchengzhania lutea]|uniref:c-type cytochrome n=1 Tax=Changchengzhania lutea TaxID=2049305 RepID=UPI00115D6725|nr:c-type cytochrome [Changchengzhania lutea]